MVGRRWLPVVGVLVLAAAAGCARVAPAGAGEPGPVPPGLERYYAQQPAWGSCAGFATTEADQAVYADTALQCARLEVPLDYAAPAGRTAQIAVLRHVSTDRARIGSLVLNPGGPGGSGTQAAAYASATLGGGPFDVVGFDPRGIGASTPRVDCLTPAESLVERTDLDVDPSPAGVAAAEAETRDYVARCVARSGGADVLANVGTRDVARDLDVLRAALGERRLTYFGTSYGTLLGSTYAEMFPGNVRALVLDGAVDPAQPVVEEDIDQLAAFQGAFDAYAVQCARAPDCPLGTDPARATATFQALTRPLVGSPIPVGAGRVLGYPDAVAATVGSLYNPLGRPALTEALRALARGDGGTLLALADTFFGTVDRDITLAVRCVDDERVTDRAEVVDVGRRMLAAAPFADPGVSVVGALNACAFWPVPPTTTPHLPRVSGLPPVLVVSTTGDPATPYRAGVVLADALGGVLLTVEGTQHGVVAQGYPCVDELVADYLVELRLPPRGVRCTLPPTGGGSGA